jgi:agmatine deiminase
VRQPSAAFSHSHSPAPRKLGGDPLEVFELPMPRRIVREDLVLPASYANFYIANNCVLLPTFADPMDEPARETLQKLFPDRKVIGIDCRELIWGLGTFHCLTQQQPAVTNGKGRPSIVEAA